jgi:RNA polymerase sigma factor (sigma-70 family)
VTPIEREAAVDDAELIRRAKMKDPEAIGLLIDRCVPALKKAWQCYRESMYERGFETADVIQEAAAVACEKIDTFRGETVAQFCAWLRQIFRNLIITQLRRPPIQNLRTDFDPIDQGQQRPSVELAEKDRLELEQDRLDALELALAQLSELDRLLIKLQLLSEPPMSWPKIVETIQADHADLWAAQEGSHPVNEYYVKQAYEKARERLDRIAKEILDEFRGSCSE